MPRDRVGTARNMHINTPPRLCYTTVANTQTTLLYYNTYPPSREQPPTKSTHLANILGTTSDKFRFNRVSIPITSGYGEIPTVLIEDTLVKFSQADIELSSIRDQGFTVLAEGTNPIVE